MLFWQTTAPPPVPDGRLQLLCSGSSVVCVVRPVSSVQCFAQQLAGGTDAPEARPSPSCPTGKCVLQ